MTAHTIDNPGVEIPFRVQDQASAEDVPSEESGHPSRESAYLEINVHFIRYRTQASLSANQHLSKSTRGSLLDRGANGGIVGFDAVVIRIHQRTVDVTGIDNHELSSLKIVDASARVMTNRGWAILIMQQYAHHPVRTTIHSAGQIEAYKNFVDDKSQKVGGKQCIKTLDGYLIPVDIISGLPYIKMQPNTKEEYDTLPHIILTGAEPWDPSVLDNIISNRDDWQSTMGTLDEGMIPQPFDEHGNYKEREIVPPLRRSKRVQKNTWKFSSDLIQCYLTVANLNVQYLNDEDDELEAGPITQRKSKIDYRTYAPYFLQVSEEKIRKTFENTTQFATNVLAGHKIKQVHKAANPAMNIWRRNEPVATDTVYAQVKSIAQGYTMAQVFIGRKSLVIDIFGMNNQAQFVNTLEDEIRKRGAMDKLISDGATTEISRRVQDILRALMIKAWQSERDKQKQNFGEQRWCKLKFNTDWVMNMRNIPPEFWFLCAEWCADVMNHTAEKSLGWKPPLEVLTGQTVDISKLLYFMFYDHVAVPRYKDNEYQQQIGSKKKSEITGRFIGFSWDVGHAMTFKIVTDDTKKIICRSRIRLLDVPDNHIKPEVNLKTTMERTFMQSVADDGSGNWVMPTIDSSKCPFIGKNDDEEEQANNQVPDTTSSNPTQTNAPSNPPSVTAAPPSEQPVRTSPTVPMTPETRDRVPPAKAKRPPTVETVDVDEEDKSPMGDPLLRERGVVMEEVDDDISTSSDETDTSDDTAATDPDDPYQDEEPTPNLEDPMKTPNPTVTTRLPPDDLIDRTFLMPPKDDGSRERAKIVKRINVYKDKRKDDPDYVKFSCLVNGEYEEIVAYNDIVDYIEQDDSWDGMWKFKNIKQIKGPMRSNHPHYKGCDYNALVEWETGELSWEPLIMKDKTGVWDTDPVTVAVFMREHNRIEEFSSILPGLKRYCKTQKRIVRRANQAKLTSYRTKPVYMFGVLIPRNYQQAIEFDKANGNTKWQDATRLELEQINDYDTFVDKGRGYIPGPGWKKITVHLVYACKHDGRFKARLVAGGHLTDTPIDSVYSSVVSLRGIRILVFLGELNECEVWATDIGNAYLEAYTKEKVYIIAGPEFEELEGHTLVISKALYGLCSSGLRWSEKFADVLRDMGFFLSKGERDVWMRDKGDHYEYIGVYVDDLIIVSKNPKSIIGHLQDTYKFKLKGTGPISFHLGCDFFRDEEGVLCYAPYKYITRMLDNYKRMFGQNPKVASSPLPGGDHPEVDTSELVDLEDTKIYQSLIGSLQWVVQIGRFDVATSVMSMSRFRAAPRCGHLERVKRIIGYLSKMRHGKIRVLTEEPDFSAFPDKHYDWTYTCYHGAKEEIPKDLPKPRGKRVVTSHCKDSNLYHCLVSGKSVTGILHFLNKTPIDWYSKLQATVETATFGSEYVAARTCTEQIIDLRTTLRYLGVPVEGPSYMFGDNESVVNTAAAPEGRLLKRHNLLSYHRTREAISAGITRFFHIRSKMNPGDLLSKHWEYSSVWGVLRPIMFWTGDTAALIKDEGDTST